jgi:hypothetical protein
MFLWLGTAGVASADSIGIGFEPSEGYGPGSINGQQGWQGQTPPGISINPAIDQAIVTNGPGAPESFGLQSWRISNAYTSGTFGDMPFSPSLKNEAGETMAHNGNGVLTFSGGTRQNHFDVQWAFTSAAPNGGGTDCSPTANPALCSYVSISPDRGDGARMSYIRLEDDLSGLRVIFDDYQDKAPYGSYGTPASAAQGCSGDDNFIETMVASGLDRKEAHTVRLSMDFVDGPRNDVVKVYVDGTLRHTGTSWEDYFRWCETGTGDPAIDQSRTVDSVLFRVGGGQTHPLNFGKGFLIDNLSYSSSTTEQCDERHADGDGDVQGGDGSRSHMHFHKGGCGSDTNDGVQHDDNNGQGHHFQSTSVASGQYTTAVDGGRTVTMVGTGVDNGLPVSFTLVAIDHDGLIPATYSLVLSDGYSFAGTLVSGTLSVL